MAAPKGNSYSSGRPKGSKNQITQDTREAYKMFVQGNLGRLNEWMDELDSPEKKLDFMLKFSEYFVPKLQRIETTGPEGGPIEHKLTFDNEQASNLSAAAAALASRARSK